MSSNWNTTPEFKKLYEEWVSGKKAKYRRVVAKDGSVSKVLIVPTVESKLEQSGFKDIEDTERDDVPLKAWHNHRFKHIPIERFVATESYYERAKSLLNTFTFKNDTHRKIWELHCQGVSKRKIVEQIKGLTPCYKRSRVGKIITLLAKECQGKEESDVISDNPPIQP